MWLKAEKKCSNRKGWRGIVVDASCSHWDNPLFDKSFIFFLYSNYCFIHPKFFLYSICSTPFELHDDNYVLKAMKFCERPQSDNMVPSFPVDGGEGSSMSGMYQSQLLPPRSNTSSRPPTSPPIPGILKARVKHEH